VPNYVRVIYHPRLIVAFVLQRTEIRKVNQHSCLFAFMVKDVERKLNSLDRDEFQLKLLSKVHTCAALRFCSRVVDIFQGTAVGHDSCASTWLVEIDEPITSAKFHYPMEFRYPCSGVSLWHCAHDTGRFLRVAKSLVACSNRGNRQSLQNCPKDFHSVLGMIADFQRIPQLQNDHDKRRHE
jgi:hypothetical protein